MFECSVSNCYARNQSSKNPKEANVIAYILFVSHPMLNLKSRCVFFLIERSVLVLEVILSRLMFSH